MSAQERHRSRGAGARSGRFAAGHRYKPVLTGRDAFDAMRQKILDAAPGSRLIPVSAEGVADEPVARSRS